MCKNPEFKIAVCPVSGAPPCVTHAEQPFQNNHIGLNYNYGDFLTVGVYFLMGANGKLE